MNQNPGYATPGGSAPPPYTPPPRRGAPWWAWMLGGCAGCALLGVIAMVVVSLMAGRWITNEMKSVGPVTEQSVRQDLGSDVPIYPNAVFDETTTRAMKIGMKFGVGIAEKASGKKLPGIFKGIGGFITTDSPSRVFQFYDKKLRADGWSEMRSTNTGANEQHMYQKGQKALIVQLQPRGDGRSTILIIRGDPNMENRMKELQPRPTPIPSRPLPPPG